MKKKESKVSKYLVLIWRLLTHPLWAWGSMRSSHLFPGNSRELNKAILDCYEKYALPNDDVLRRIGKISEDQLHIFLNEAKAIRINEELKTSRIPSIFDASNELALLCYVVTRARKPLVVVETGVGRGGTSLYILRALEKNGQGHLYSIDLPILKKGAKSEVGILVPASLRSRWTLLFGWSLHEMNKLRKNINKIDLFVHDSDHSYLNQKAEYEISIRWLSENGVLLSDDVQNAALLECFEKYGGELMVIKQSEDRYLGILGIRETGNR